MSRFKKNVCIKIKEWNNNIKKLKSKNDFKKSHYVKLFGSKTGLLNKCVLEETLGFKDIKPSKSTSKESDYYKRCCKLTSDILKVINNWDVFWKKEWGACQ